MNKKQLAALVAALVSQTAAAHGCSEAEAQTLVGLVLRSKANELVAATNPPAVAPVAPVVPVVVPVAQTETAAA